MSEATLILENMRGGCATVGSTVHTLFRFKGHRPNRLSQECNVQTIRPADIAEAIEMMQTHTSS